MKNAKYLILAAMLLSASIQIHAQGGCVDSPEDPTAVLAILGVAGASIVYARNRMAARKNRK